jgi:hypothetical protein
VTGVTAASRYPFGWSVRQWGVTKSNEGEHRECESGSADRKFRAFVVAPVLIVAGVLVGPASGPAIVLYALAGVMVGTAAAKERIAAR